MGSLHYIIQESDEHRSLEPKQFRAVPCRVTPDISTLCLTSWMHPTLEATKPMVQLPCLLFQKPLFTGPTCLATRTRPKPCSKNRDHIMGVWRVAGPPPLVRGEQRSAEQLLCLWSVLLLSLHRQATNTWHAWPLNHKSMLRETGGDKLWWLPMRIQAPPAVSPAQYQD